MRDSPSGESGPSTMTLPTLPRYEGREGSGEVRSYDLVEQITEKSLKQTVAHSNLIKSASWIK